jgi:hypothetical protein
LGSGFAADLIHEVARADTPKNQPWAGLGPGGGAAIVGQVSIQVVASADHHQVDRVGVQEAFQRRPVGQVERCGDAALSSGTEKRVGPVVENAHSGAILAGKVGKDAILK